MLAFLPPSEKVTLEQYEVLPENFRAEVFDGVLYNMASPSQLHQTILLELASLLNTCVKQKKSGNIAHKELK